MVVESNYTVTDLRWLLQEVKSKEKKPIRFLQKNILIEILERLIRLVINY